MNNLTPKEKYTNWLINRCGLDLERAKYIAAKDDILNDLEEWANSSDSDDQRLMINPDNI